MRLLSTLALAAALASPAAARPDEEIAVGLPAPGFTLRTLDPDERGAATVRLDLFVGPEAEGPGAKVVLLSFFAASLLADVQRALGPEARTARAARPE